MMPLLEADAVGEAFSSTVVIVGLVGLGVLVGAFAAVRIWLAMRRPPHDNIATPTIDRLSSAALARMTQSPEEAEAVATEAETEEAPADLLAALPPENPPQAGAAIKPPAAPAKSDADRPRG
jgi:hypothetical protein